MATHEDRMLAVGALYGSLQQQVDYLKGVLERNDDNLDFVVRNLHVHYTEVLARFMRDAGVDVTVLYRERHLER